MFFNYKQHIADVHYVYSTLIRATALSDAAVRRSLHGAALQYSNTQDLDELRTRLLAISSKHEDAEQVRTALALLS